MRAWILAGAMAMAVFGAGSASAQPTDPDDGMGEEYCVYKKLSKSTQYEVVAEAYLMGFQEDEARAAVKAAADACIQELGMSEDQAALASEVGIYGASADYLYDDLLLATVPESVIEQLPDVIDEISDDDLDRLFDSDWRNDAGMKARMRAAVLAKGVLEDDGVIELAFDLIETTAFGMEAAMAYVMGDLGLDEDET